MALIDEVSALCNRLAPGGWHNVLLHHGLVANRPVPDRPRARYLANVQSFAATFDKGDTGITAIVSQPDTRVDGNAALAPKVASAQRASCLPDAAAEVFAPGWDTGLDFDENKLGHLAAYKLGSPFPEDAKLCAALSSFWPAVAPDSVQAFEFSPGRHTVKPMLGTEIGLAGGLPWDSISPPRHCMNNEQPHIAYTSSLFGDYTQNALDGKFSLALTGTVGNPEYQQRVDALSRVRLSIGERYREWRITSFRRATNEDLDTAESSAELQVFHHNNAYRFELVRSESAPSANFDTVHVTVIDTLTFLVWPEHIWQRRAALPWQRA